jgi:LacI family transcriptional regulator
LRKRSTLKQLAESLDVSIATVSRALGGYPDIALETRERVQAQAKKMGYVPNSAGRMLVSGRSGFVGLVVPTHGGNFMDSFLGQFVLGLGEGLATFGSDLFLAIVPEGKSELDVIRKLVDSGRADALVLTRITEDDERVNFLLDRRVPFITHGRLHDRAAPYHWLDTCGASAFTEAFDRLYALGHRRFGLVSISEPMSARLDREAGLAAAMAAKGDPTLSLVELRRPRPDTEPLRADIVRLLGSAERPTAIIGLFDELALLVMQEARRQDLDVPRDLSVIGFDNVLAAAHATPGLSTFDQDVRGSARTMAGMLNQAMENPEIAPLSVLKTPQFVARGSHGQAPGC